MSEETHWSARRIPPCELFIDPGPQPELFAGLCPAQTTILFGGAGGLGKTTLILMMALSVITQRQLFGRFTPAKRGNVVLFLGEDTDESARRMLKRIADALELTIEDRELVADLLHLVPLSGVVAKMTTRSPNTRQLQVAADIEHLIKGYRGIGHIAFMSFDPGLRFHDGVESANEDGDVLIQAMNRVRQELDTTVVLVVHTNKEARGQKGDVDFGRAFRGASSLVDGARHAILMVGMSEDRAKVWGVDQAVRDRWVELVAAKANLMEKPEAVTLVRKACGIFHLGQKGTSKRLLERKALLIERVIGKIRSEQDAGRNYSKYELVKRFSGTDGPLQAAKHPIDEAIKTALEAGQLVRENHKILIPKCPESLPLPDLPDRETQNGRETVVQ